MRITYEAKLLQRIPIEALVVLLALRLAVASVDFEFSIQYCDFHMLICCFGLYLGFWCAQLGVLVVVEEVTQQQVINSNSH